MFKKIKKWLDKRFGIGIYCEGVCVHYMNGNNLIKTDNFMYLDYFLHINQKVVSKTNHVFSHFKNNKPIKNNFYDREECERYANLHYDYLVALSKRSI